jgi:hypothetical protein
MATKAEWLARAHAALLDLLDREHAVVWREVEAKLSDKRWRERGQVIDPHLLTTVRSQLRFERVIEEITAPTRGGREVPVWALTDRRGRQRRFLDAAARKRLLYARYLGWADMYLGRSGEQVTHASLVAAAPAAGYRLFQPQGGEIRQLFGRPIAGGPLDNAATLQIVDEVSRPISHSTVLVEVKNIRHTLYADAPELFELLDKASRVQLANPAEKIVPVLVCRWAHITAFRMAKDLGMVIADAWAQFLPDLAELDQRLVAEVRNELGFRDLIVTNDAYPRLVRLLATDLPAIALGAAQRFAQTAPIIAQYAPRLRRQRGQRQHLFRQFRAAIGPLRATRGW